jgi:hypothetical protein
MTFADLKLMLAQDVNRSDKETVWYPIWINRALHRIQMSSNFSGMKQRLAFTIPAGQSSVLLGAQFKELTPELSAVTVSDPSLPAAHSELPCEVVSREYLINYRAAANVPTIPPNVRGRLSGLPVFIENTSSGWTLNIAANADEAINFKVSHFRFVDDLVNDSDTNFLLKDYPDLVESKLKAIAFGSLNDPLMASFESLAAGQLSEAVLTDNRRQYRGRALRMGG